VVEEVLAVRAQVLRVRLALLPDGARRAVVAALPALEALADD
jgi:hypothetical protein